MKKLLKWLDNNILKIVLVGYIFFIPLFPKIPFKMVDYTYIAIRFEDFFVAIVYVLFAVQLLRRKVTLNKKYLILFGLFWISVFVSFYLGFFVQKTIIIKNVGFLNALRRVEYMAIFFVFAAVVKSWKDVMFYLRLILVVFAIVCMYGLGQKYLGWPAVQTMNPEYAKGYFLVLDSFARISSTFAGHYDLAAYLILFIPVILALTIQTNPWFFALFLIALSNLVLTASRVSYGAYIASAFPFLLWNKKFKLILIVIVATVGMTLLSNNLTNRLSRTFQVKQVFVDRTSGQITVPRKIQADDLPPGDFVLGTGGTGVDATSVNTKDSREAQNNIRDQIREQARKQGKTLTKSQEDALLESALNNMKVIQTVVPDISVATRLQVEWPRAIRAFFKYPIFGKGPSSITEATDNDYLRWLGEFGAVGTLLFLAILGNLFIDIFKEVRKKDTHWVLLLGVLAGFGGLLVNATYIDIFEASKVAFVFWMFMGIFIGYIYSLPNKKKLANKKI